MRKLGMMAATMLVAFSILASPLAEAGNSKGICQAGGYNDVVLADAMAKYWRWYYGGGGPQEIGPLFLVPMPSEGDWTSVGNVLTFQGSRSFELRTGKTLVLPLSFFLGESYVDGSADDPANYPIDYKASTLLLTVDGRVIVDSSRTGLDCVYIDVTYLTPPISYPEPTGYGSNAAIWMMGLGILLPPLSPGAHIIEMQVMSDLTQAPGYGFFLGYYNTWYVTVVRP